MARDGGDRPSEGRLFDDVGREHRYRPTPGGCASEHGGSQPPVKSNRQDSHSPAAQQYGRVPDHSSNSFVAPSISRPIEHNDRLQDPSVPSVGTASPRPAPGLEHRGGPPNSPPTRFSASAADPTPPFQRRGRGPDSLCRQVSLRLIPRCQMFSPRRPSCFGVSPFERTAAVGRCFRQQVVRNILRTEKPVRSRRLGTVDTEESVWRHVGLSMRKASEVWFVYHHQ